MAELGRASRSARYIVDKLQALADLLVGMGTTTAAGANARAAALAKAQAPDGRQA
jgi:hypothetical protein